MNKILDFSRIKTSWTKYDIVRVMEVIYDEETLIKYKNKEANIDEPILRSFLGIKSLEEPIPDYWIEIQDFPNEKKLFGLFAAIFTHGEIVKKFAEKYCKGNMKGLFTIEKGKQYTNIRSALIEAGAAAPSYRKMSEVPFDFAPIFQNTHVGMLFKKVLSERLSRLTNNKLTDELFYETCYHNSFHKAISLTEEQFKFWLEGIQERKKNYISKISIKNFYSIKEVKLDEINESKEIYFLGENGDGKSLLLMAIYLAFNRHFILDQTDKEETGKVVDILRSNKKLELIGIDNSGKEYGDKNVGYLDNLYAYGTHRGRFSTDRSEEYGFMSLFDSNQTLINPISWLKDQKLLELEKELDPINGIGEKEELPSSFSVRRLEKLFHELLERNVNIQIEGTEVKFIEKGTSLSFDQLSEGYKSIIIFVSDLLYRLQNNQPKSKQIEELHGIVLVDEIDLHLHPKWQRVLITKLRNLLPGVQFIFTTHSPTIIQGASDNAIIYRVFRNSVDGFTRVSDPYYRKDLNHLMINTLLTSPLFGLDNSRLDSDNDNADTSNTYLLYRINEKLRIELDKQKKGGKEFISNNKIEALIQKMIDEEFRNK